MQHTQSFAQAIDTVSQREREREIIFDKPKRGSYYFSIIDFAATFANSTSQYRPASSAFGIADESISLSYTYRPCTRFSE
jgi:hypothetical protein